MRNENIFPYLIPFLFLPFILGGKKSTPSSSTAGGFTDVKQIDNIPFAQGNSSALWPIQKTSNSKWNVVSYQKSNGSYEGNPARAFGASREGRHHVGIDLYCNNNDICIATENGDVVQIQGFLNITKALMIETDSGIVLLYGEIKDKSWNEFNITEGSRVKKGQPICRMGYNQAGTVMLHFETYKKGTRENSPWYVGNPPPPSILNPTKYLLNCLRNMYLAAGK